MQAIFAGKAQSSQNKSCPKKRNRNQKPCFLAAERVSTHPPFSSLQILGSILSRAGARPLPSPASFLPSWPRMRQHVIYSPPGVHFSFFYCDLLLVCWAQLLSFRKGLWKGSGLITGRLLPVFSLLCWYPRWGSRVMHGVPHFNPILQILVGGIKVEQQWPTSHRTNNPLSLGRWVGSCHPCPFCLLITAYFCIELCNRIPLLYVFPCKMVLSKGNTKLLIPEIE